MRNAMLLQLQYLRWRHGGPRPPCAEPPDCARYTMPRA
jgi:hypothetical protein